jgi:hypothetical protein
MFPPSMRAPRACTLIRSPIRSHRLQEKP